VQLFVYDEELHGILDFRGRLMETVTDSRELVVWAEKGALAEAKDTFSRFDASFRTIPSASSTKEIPTSKVSLFYLRDAEPNAEFESILKAFKGHKTSFVVLYTPHHSSDFAFRMGKIVGKHSLDSADWAFNLRHVEQLLRARNVVAHRGHKPAERFDIGAARKRLGLTQEQMANALNVTTRTLQNWESGLGTSQMPKKTQDLRELLGLMDDYVLAPKEREWLGTPLPAVQNRRPTDVISSGKLRDLIVEFQRLREGQPI
jgi:transcriptional regulator with XRE-family HTH domain